MKTESVDESYVPVSARRAASRLCGYHTKCAEHHKNNPLKLAMHQRQAARSALTAGLSVTNPKGTQNQGLLNHFNIGYAKAHKKLTGKAIGERSPLDAREHIFGFVAESTTQEYPMQITEILTKITSGEITSEEAAKALSQEIVERSLKPRALQRFVAWGKQGNERRTRGDLPGAANAEYQKANGPHLGESEEEVDPVGALMESLSAEILGEAVIEKGADLSGHKMLDSNGTCKVNVGKGVVTELEVLDNDEYVTGVSQREHGVKYICRTKNHAHAKAFHDFKSKHTGVLTPIKKHDGYSVFGYGHKHPDAHTHLEDRSNMIKKAEAARDAAIKAAKKSAAKKKK
jgi:hypothetical protein